MFPILLALVTIPILVYISWDVFVNKCGCLGPKEIECRYCLAKIKRAGDNEYGCMNCGAIMVYLPSYGMNECGIYKIRGSKLHPEDKSHLTPVNFQKPT